MNEIRGLVLMVLSALGGFFMPITDFMLAILVLLGCNFFSGWIEDELHGEGWKWKKAFKTFYECLVMVAIGAFVFVMGHFMHKEGAAVQCLSAIYLAGIWFYSVNILTNWKKILPEGTTLWLFVNFLHFIISMKFVEKIPYLKEFLQQAKTQPKSKLDIALEVLLGHVPDEVREKAIEELKKEGVSYESGVEVG